MKCIPLVFLTLVFARSQAQTNNAYKNDLIELHNVLQKTYSYKDQIKGENLVSYKLLFETLLSDTVKNVSDYNYFYNLAHWH